MAEPLLSTGDVCALTGLTPNTLDRWCSAGIVLPFDGGNGQGDHRRFTLLQAVGLQVAASLRQAEGATLGLVRTIVATFEAMTRQELLAAFEAGQTHVVYVTPSRAFLGPSQYPHMDHRDVQAKYDAIDAGVEELTKQLTVNRQGRRRGLVGGTVR